MDKIGFYIPDGKIRDQAKNNLPIKTGKINSTNLYRSFIRSGGRTFKLSGEISKDANFLTSWDWDTGGSYKSQHQKSEKRKTK